MTATTKAPPDRLYWTLCSLVLPAANVLLLFARPETVYVTLLSGACGVGALAVPAMILAVEIVALGRLLAHEGYEGRELGGWMIAGAVATVALTVAYAVATFLIVYLIAAAGCPPGAYECPI
jgi:hypothetical protein